MVTMYQISFYVPEAQCDQVKQAMFKAGAGVFGNYQECAWQTLGEGQFKPLEGSQAFIGEVNKLEKLTEYKVEMVCQSNRIKQVIEALKESHPYEEPAYSVLKLVDIS